MSQQAELATATVPTGGPWWSRPDARVSVLSASIGVLTFASFVMLIISGPPTFDRRDLVVLGVLGVLLAATEGFAIHLRVRRGGHAMSLSEIPMVLGLLSTDPLLLVLSRVIGGGVGLVFLRGQRGLKLGFNLALLGAQATVAAWVFRTVAGSAAPLGPGQWLAAYAAMLAADVLALVLVTAAISLHDDAGEWRRLPSALRGVPLVAITTSVALVSALVVERDVRAIALLAVVSSVVYIAYRAYMRQSQGNAQVEGLYRFTRALDGSLETVEVARIVLDQVRDQLRAEAAELIVPGVKGQPYLRTRMSGQGEIETSSLDVLPTDAWWTPAAHGRTVLLAAAKDRVRSTDDPVDAVAVPVPMGAGATGVLLVTDSLPDIRTFGEDHVPLFQALANHASVTLIKTRLVDMLREEVNEKEHLALHDPLTGLPNRRHFHRLLTEALDAGDAGAQGIVVMLMDLDRFKEVNDALGHDVGDSLLQEVAIRLQWNISGLGVVARLGGDEFAVLLSGVGSAEEAVVRGDEFVRAIDQPVTVGQLTLNTRASIGVALAPEHGIDAKTLLQRADVAMYAAKGARSGARVYHRDDDRNTPDRLALIGDLRQAVLRNEMLVAFQAKLDPGTGLVTGAEALARWHHPQFGSIPPDDFIPLAEHSGLIRPLTLHILEVALRRCAAWRRSGHDLHVAVNLSANGLLDTTLPDAVAVLLAQTGVPAPALTLEITESSIMADPAGSLATLDRLNTIGVKLAIDDFGTGYSSLARLRELPIHEMKIDKSFVQRVSIDHRDRAVVRSAVQLGHALELKVVAEGVEDGATLAHLTREGCNIVQGFFVSRPLMADDFALWLTNRTVVEPQRNVVYPRFGT